jgi:hypothetical protein
MLETIQGFRFFIVASVCAIASISSAFWSADAVRGDKMSVIIRSVGISTKNA